LSMACLEAQDCKLGKSSEQVRIVYASDDMASDPRTNARALFGHGLDAV